MPVRDGRWVSWATIKAAEAEAAAAEPVADEPVVEQAPKAPRTRRTNKAALAAIADATGVQATINEDALPTLGDVSLDDDTEATE